MRPDISAFQTTLRTALARRGWQAEAHELDTWWCHECWRLQSLWAPQGLRAFLTFLIDPQSDGEQMQRGDYQVFGVKASPAVPAQWQDADAELTISFSRHWTERQLPGLITHLDTLRHSRTA